MSPVTSPEQLTSTTYDYVIVGGGTAGLTVAARLSEIPDVTVAVLEAGGWDPAVPGVNIPGLMGANLMKPEHDWAFMTVPQTHANNRPVYLPRGKGLGGSSALNFLGMHRGPANEYDAIERLGNPGWNWAEFLKYFKKSETTHPLDPEVAKKYTVEMPDEKWHGSSGPIEKSYPLHFNPIHSEIVATLENIGIPLNSEPNSGNILGAATQMTSVDPRNVTRSYSASAYYVPNMARNNLTVIVDSPVSKIVFEPGSSPLVATGVEFINKGNKYTVSARKEVILAAGTFQSPQVLELSGVGNKQLLERFGITTLLDLPEVGENLQDHIFAPMIYEIDPAIDTVDDIQVPEKIAKAFELYAKKEGSLTSALTDIFAFFPAHTFASTEEMKIWDDDAAALEQAASGGYKKQLAIQRQWYTDSKSVSGEFVTFPGFFHPSGLECSPGVRYSSMIAIIMHPLARGSVHIASADPTVTPAIDPNYIGHPQDLQTAVSMLKLGLKAYDTAPLRDIVRKQVAPPPEVCADDAALAEFIKKTCSHVFHPIGSLAMMPREDGGVVDPRLRVYGTANVRVVDASILPIEISSHIQATVYAIAEKAADIIKEDMGM